MPDITDDLLKGFAQIWYLPLILIAFGLLKIFLYKLEKKYKTKKKQKNIYNHIKMVDEQKEKYKRDKEQRIKEEKIRLKKEYYEREKRKI